MSHKVLMIHGSPRKKNTERVLLQIGELLQKYGIESEILRLSDYHIAYCRGCDATCNGNSGCNQKDDDMEAIRQKILASDALVLASPVYLNGVTSRFKTFIDRTNGWFHNPATAGKPVLSVATTAVSGLKETRDVLESFATGLGARTAGFVGRSMKDFDQPVRQEELAKFIAQVTGDKKNYKPSIPQLAIFEVQKQLALKFGGANQQFWEDNGWLDKIYYYDCKINPFKKLLVKALIRRSVRKQIG